MHQWLSDLPGLLRLGLLEGIDLKFVARSIEVSQIESVSLDVAAVLVTHSLEVVLAAVTVVSAMASVLKVFRRGTRMHCECCADSGRSLV